MPLLFFACQDETLNKDYSNIEQDIEIALSQNVNEFGPYTELIINTLDSVDCKNTQLEVELKNIAEKIEVYINGLSKSSDCVVGMSKPTSYSNIGNSSYDQTISFILKESIISEGTMYQKEGKVELNLELPKGLVLKNSTILKIDNNTVWGTLSTNNSKELTEFTTLLDKNKQSTYAPKSGNYGLFQYFNESEIWITDRKIQNPLIQSKRFFIQYRNWDNLVNDIKAYKLLHPDAIVTGRNFRDKSL